MKGHTLDDHKLREKLSCLVSFWREMKFECMLLLTFIMEIMYHVTTQVELVLSVEERMPKWFQERIGWGTKKWLSANVITRASEWQKFLHLIWGGKLYNLHENIDAVLNPPVVSTV